MADEYVQLLTEETAPVATDFMAITDNGTQRLRKIKYGLINFEIQTSTPDTNVTGEVGVLDVVTMSSMTADRDYTLPTTAIVGDRCGIAVVDGNDTYEILIKSGAAGDKINNVDHSSTEWSRLFIAGEKVTFVCIDAAGPHWLVETDGRIPCKTELTRNAAQSIGNGTPVKILLDTKTFDIGNLGDIVTNNRITIRRNSRYIINCFCKIPGIDDNEEVVVEPYLNGTINWVGRDSCTYNNDLEVCARSTAIDYFSVDNYLELYVYQNSGGAQNILVSTHNKARFSVFEIF